MVVHVERGLPAVLVLEEVYHLTETVETVVAELEVPEDLAVVVDRE